MWLQICSQWGDCLKGDSRSRLDEFWCWTMNFANRRILVSAKLRITGRVCMRFFISLVHFHRRGRFTALWWLRCWCCVYKELTCGRGMMSYSQFCIIIYSVICIFSRATLTLRRRLHAHVPRFSLTQVFFGSDNLKAAEYTLVFLPELLYVLLMVNLLKNTQREGSWTEYLKGQMFLIAFSARHSHCCEQRHPVYLWYNLVSRASGGTLAGMESAVQYIHQQSLVETPVYIKGKVVKR